MLEREYFQQGWIFKDWRAFRNNMDAPCYVPELDDTVYTKKDFYNYAIIRKKLQKNYLSS